MREQLFSVWEGFLVVQKDLVSELFGTISPSFYNQAIC